MAQNSTPMTITISQPSLTMKKAWRCTVHPATTMVPITPAAARGVRKPTRISRPQPISVHAAM